MLPRVATPLIRGVVVNWIMDLSNNNKAAGPKPAKRVRRRKTAKAVKPKSSAPALKKGAPPPSTKEAVENLQLVRTLKAVAADRGQACRDYVKHLVDPWNEPAVRIPNALANARPTGLVQSVMSIDVPVNFSAGTSNGQFGICISPTMGDASMPSKYKVAMANIAGSFPTNFTVPANFQQTAGTTCLTVDPNANSLLQSTPWNLTGNAPITAPQAATADPCGVIPGNFTYNNCTTDSANPNLGATPIFTSTTVGGATTIIFLPPGQFNIQVDIAFTAAEAAGRTLVGLNVDSNVSFSNQYQQSSTTLPSAQFVVSVYGQSGRFGIRWLAQPTGAWTADVDIGVSWYRPDNLVNPPTQVINGASVFAGYPLDGGLVREYVPVAMCALLTSEMPELLGGGNVSCAWLSPDTCDKDMFTAEPRPSVGNLFNFQNLRKYPGAYDGKAQDGLYQMWVPSDAEDTKFYTPTAARNRPWPCLAMAGVVLPASAITGIHSVFRLRITTTYQFYTDIQYIPLQVTDGSTLVMEEAFRLLQTFPKSSANGPHWENIKTFFRKAFRFVSDNAGPIGMIGKGVLTLAAVL